MKQTLVTVKYGQSLAKIRSRKPQFHNEHKPDVPPDFDEPLKVISGN